MTELTVPGDKSITHRALILAALADGTSRIRGVLAGEDAQSTATVLRALGTTIPALEPETELRIEGLGRQGFNEPEDELDCGNSGTTTRLMMGVVAGQSIGATFTGDASLRRRPMRRVTAPLEQMGARVIELGEPGRLPIRIEGAKLRAISFVSEQASAQVKSAILLAGLVSGASAQVTEPLASRDHTERLLRAMGAQVDEQTLDNGTHIVRVGSADHLRPIDLRIPGDFSSAAFLIAAALLGVLPAALIIGVGVNPTRTGLLDILQRMGAAIELRNLREVGGEPVADISARASELRGVEVEPQLVPRLIDEIPILAILAARALGSTTIRGAGELRVKESDRIRALVDNLSGIGAAATELPDGLMITGTAKPLSGAVRTALDHRIAMAFGVLAGEAKNRVEIDDRAVAAVSFPGFWQILGQPA
ncbi:MAG TPA: 3-phosphoshikimate 1-carboxyvinyltransferase [Longimicrobiales bacterium]|nr:3-phosphoshikimate 1-carboxyvinyltransferase [Longimicrobiales bacterium]